MPQKPELFKPMPFIQSTLNALLFVLPLALRAPASENQTSISALKKMSLEELMDVDVTLVSKQSEKLNAVASAVQVITQDAIRRSGATNLPEALRLASNLQVAQLDGREWAISARGFNNTAANKLLVMIDGRTVYTPLYSGVFWDAQSVFLEDVERIEVVSGPGGTLWGSNAVNGVIHVVTARADSTQGAYIATGVGTYQRDFIHARYGGKADPRTAFRVYSQHQNRNGVTLRDGTESQSPSRFSQAGFRVDRQQTDRDQVTVQGDLYDGAYGTPHLAGTAIMGQNLMGIWNRTFSSESDLQVQVYFDHTWRKSTLSPTLVFRDDLKTYDFDLHHRFPLIGRQSVLWGAGYRLMQNHVGNFMPLAFLPASKDMHRFNGFVQDEITLVPDQLKATLGTKVEHEGYSGFNLQPAAKVAWTPTDKQVLWGSVSRAVRTPSRIDVEFYAPEPPVTPGTLKYAGSPEFESEKMIAYELGYRLQPIEAVSFSAATFYNRYDDLRSTELPNPSNLTVEFRNGLEGDSRGIELSAQVQALSWWQLRGGYTYLEKDLWEKPGHTDFTKPRGEWIDPAYQMSLQSMMDLPVGFQVNAFGYYVDRLPGPGVPKRFAYDASLVWRYRNIEASAHGRNLADDHDPEFRTADNRGLNIPRSVYGKLSFRL
jgi:iron complex outermembrane recepter protein